MYFKILPKKGTHWNIVPQMYDPRLKLWLYLSTWIFYPKMCKLEYCNQTCELTFNHLCAMNVQWWAMCASQCAVELCDRSADSAHSKLITAVSTWAVQDGYLAWLGNDLGNVVLCTCSCVAALANCVCICICICICIFVCICEVE